MGQRGRLFGMAGRHRWERGPYYLDGLLPLSYYLKDGKRWEICRKFLDWTLKSQDSEGNFGPERTKQDYWSRFIMLKVMLQYYEITGDEVIVGFIETLMPVGLAI